MDALIPEVIEPDAYHRDRLNDAYAKARELEVMTEEEADRRAAKEYDDSVASKARYVESHRRSQEIYDSMLAKVEAWEPPTSEHVGMKKFMREQIELSKTSFYDWPIHRASGKAWLANAREMAAEEVRESAEKWRAAQERAARDTEWLRALRASLTGSKVQP